MKSLKVLLVGLLVVGLAAPAFAQDEGKDWSFELGTFRYRFDHEVSSVFGTDETQEYMDDDFDSKWTFTKGDISLYYEIELADNNLGDDNVAQSSWDGALGAYGAKWTPESMADSGFSLQVGDFGTGFGNNINNDDSPHGSIEVAWNMGDIGIVLGYGKRYEGDTNDGDVEGDEHLIRGQVHTPLGESGFNFGAYLALYAGTDLIFAEAVDATDTTDAVAAVTGERSVVLGAVEFSGTVGSLDIASEVGFASGSTDETGVDIDLSGFYAMGGASFALGQISLAVEAGFGSGDDDLTDDKDEGFTAVNSDFWLGEIMHDEELITRTNGSGGGLSNIVYVSIGADMSPSEKLDLSGGLVYLAPIEEVNGADVYGIELYGSATYALADYVSYSLFWGFAMPDEDFVADDQFQVVNRLQFSF